MTADPQAVKCSAVTERRYRESRNVGVRMHGPFVTAA